MKLLRFALITWALVVLLAAAGHAQAPAGYTHVYATSMTDAAGNPLSGVITFTPTNAGGTAIGFKIGGGGTGIIRPVQATVSNGSFALNLADVSLSTPSYFCYAVTAVDNAGNTVLGGSDYSCIQPYGPAYDFDNYAASTTPILPPANAQFNGNLQVNGSITATGNIYGTLDSPTTINFSQLAGTLGVGQASGAYNISITGNAATATTASTASSATTAATATTATTAAALSATPTQCSGGTPISTGIQANGNANCIATPGFGSSSLATNGYTVLPNGLVEEWGSIADFDTGPLAITFPLAFTTAVYSIQMTNTDASRIWTAQSITLTGFNAHNDGNGAATWFAVGK